MCFEVRLPWVQIPALILAVWLWANYLTHLDFVFLIHKMGMIPTRQANKIAKEIAEVESSPQTWHIGSLLLCSIVSESHCFARLFMTLWTIQSMEFPRPEYWSGLPFPSPGDLPNPGIESRSPALQADSLLSEPPGKPNNTGVGSLSLLQQIFPHRNWTGISCIAGGFFTSWSTGAALYSAGKPPNTVSLCMRQSLNQVMLSGASKEGVKRKSSSIIHFFSFIPDTGDSEPGTEGRVCDRWKCSVSHVPSLGNGCKS